MTKFAAILAVSAALAAPAYAGGYSDPIVETPVVIEDTTASSSSNGATFVLLTFATLAAAALSN